MYGSQWSDRSEVDSDRIQSFHMQALHRILGIRWYNKVSNAVVNERTKLPDLLSLIADRRHSLFGHIYRQPENIPASQALQLSIEAHTGTPLAADWKRTSAGSSTKNMTATSGRRHWPVSVGTVQITSQDRSMWRTLRPSAGQAQQ